jgi:hypothetical protein
MERRTVIRSGCSRRQLVTVLSGASLAQLAMARRAVSSRLEPETMRRVTVAPVGMVYEKDEALPITVRSGPPFM